MSELLRYRYRPSRGWSGDPEVIALIEEHAIKVAECDALTMVNAQVMRELARLEALLRSWGEAKLRAFHDGTEIRVAKDVCRTYDAVYAEAVKLAEEK